MRHKIPDNKKKKKITTTIDKDIYQLMEEYMNDNNIKNKSKFIEDLLKKNLNK